MALGAHIEASGFPDMLRMISKPEPNKAEPLHSHILRTQ